VGLRWLVTALAVAVAAGGVVERGSARAQSELLVSGAISLREALQEIGTLFEQRHPDVKVLFNFGASGILQHQIERGAPVDVFISAGTKQMDDLQSKGLILDGTRRTLMANRLVLIKPSDLRFKLGSFTDLLKPEVKRIAIGNPRTVPAGEYAQEVLRSLKLWDGLQAKLILTENVRQALVYAVRGEVEAALVFATDAQSAAGQVQVVAIAPENSHTPVTYPIAVLKSSKLRAPASAFVEMALGSEGQQILGRHGFRLLLGARTR
jgi:molybdate transport system substrate-binding protein